MDYPLKPNDATNNSNCASLTLADVLKSPLKHQQQFSVWMTDHGVTLSDALVLASRLENHIAANVSIEDTPEYNELSKMSFAEFKCKITWLVLPEGLEQCLASRADGLRSGVEVSGTTAIVSSGKLPSVSK
ncbi:papain-like cysteine protease C1 [Phytophthora cinnamomi]|uniref:papain-like cysteine protease C1 n=1 Tax=Phytophthora cinnamomi TaxID=4785 RepID=UPI003559B731|nr:papain-like cysteine protease C1 [Phytophthora cinnamomi]